MPKGTIQVTYIEVLEQTHAYLTPASVFFIQTLKVQLFYQKNTDYYDKLSPNPQGVGFHLKVLRSSCISLIALLATSTTLRPHQGG